ncbi:MAG: lamin tail domain-containing protein [Anaerolineales bacterium]|nr:lamin tail domain-containing protein [Anaerolineales bacterium]
MLNRLSPGKRLLFYLVINIIVSALTTLLVLVIWSRFAFGGAPVIGAPAGDGAAASLSGVAINAVIGAGDLANERVLLVHEGEADVSLAGWRLRDENNNEYRFPALVLHPGAQVNLHSGAGDDTAAALFWGRLAPVWRSGERARLLDASGAEQATYTVP